MGPNPELWDFYCRRLNTCVHFYNLYYLRNHKQMKDEEQIYQRVVFVELFLGGMFCIDRRRV